MPISELRLIKRFIEYVPKKQWVEVPPRVRGIYALYKYRRRNKAYNVVYVGMSGGPATGVRGRIKNHFIKKAELWTHFSIFQVWDNVREEEVRELEGILRQIYRKDAKANKLNVQKRFKKLRKVQRKDLSTLKS